MVGNSQGQRKVSDNKGLFGNRVPSSTSSPGLVPAPTPASAVKGTSVRSNSPGSVDSSYKPGSSNSPHTSRSSSPATSLGVGLPASLVEHSLPERGGSGTATPSSTRADIGEETTELSPPTTPVAAPEMPQDDNLIRSDLTPHNLPANAVAANPLLRSLSGGPTPSLTSSMASQYDSKGGSEDQTQMMHDVSEISTPMGTPRAAARGLEGSVGGSVEGGSVADINDLGSRLEGLDTSDAKEGGSDAGGSVAASAGKGESLEADKEEADEPAKEEEDVSMDNNTPKEEETTTATEGIIAKSSAEEETVHEPMAGEAPTDHPQGILQDPKATVETVELANNDPKPTESSDRDPNLDDDLDDLKEGKLEHKSTDTDIPTDEIPADNLSGGMLGQNEIEPEISKDEVKHQGGVAGQRMEDVENADQVIQPDDVESNVDDGGPEIEDATPSNDTLENRGVAIEDGKDLGPRGSLDGPQKFSVEFLEESRGTEKAAELDQSEYHMSKKEEESEKVRSATGEKAEGEEKTSEAPAGEAEETTLPAPDDKAVEAKPMQVQIEPAPIAQPASEPESVPEDTQDLVPDTSDEPTPSAEIDPPTFPAPPSEDPDVVDPISSANSDTGASTPIDPSIVKAFPDVPDEEKPRVEVHVSSPLTTPSKEKTMNNFTPLADIPGKSKSLQSLAAESEQDDDLESSADTPEAQAKHKRRLSARKSPKSPLLDDEDPGDFAPGEGWAVVTK
jgi:hypothetical protein